jgi:rare lipoprotein A
MRIGRLALTLGVLTLLAACGSQPVRQPYKRTPVYHRPPRTQAPAPTPSPQPEPATTANGQDEKDGFPDPQDIPPGLEDTPDPVPVPEPRSAGGNAKSYEVFGKTYTVRDTAAGYHERGGASWYGKKFHGRKTSNGERYNMYAMTAAHRSLPIPSFVRVTNLDNGKTCVVRINDRGPFHSDRIIDLSYAAAVKLGMLRHGEIQVDVRALTPSQRDANAEPQAVPKFLEVGVFDDPINAVALREELASNGMQPLEIRSNTENATTRHRVLIGPFASIDALETSRRLLEAARYGAKPVVR